MMRRTTATAALLLVCAAAAAQDMAETEPSEIPSYRVEVIVFEYAEDVGVGTEQFLPEELLQAHDETAGSEFVFGDATVQPAPGQRDEADRETDADAWDAEPDFMRHDETEFTMTDVASRLERLDVYRPLMHFAWTQVTRPEEKTRPIELRELAEPADGLDGSFALYLSRYLHLVVDLSIERDAVAAVPPAIDDSEREFRDDGAAPTYDAAGPYTVRFRIFEDRIFKSGDLRYFDHPKFGVLAKISRVEEPGGAQGENGLIGKLGQ
jgi:hypothetical protein